MFKVTDYTCKLSLAIFQIKLLNCNVRKAYSFGYTKYLYESLGHMGASSSYPYIHLQQPSKMHGEPHSPMELNGLLFWTKPCNIALIFVTLWIITMATTHSKEMMHMDNFLGLIPMKVLNCHQMLSQIIRFLWSESRQACLHHQG